VQAGQDLDLCLVKIKLKPGYWFRVASEIPPKGSPLYMIGNTLETSFDLRAGKSTGDTIEKIQGKAKLEVTAPVRPGFSGGPIFDSKGYLVCIASDRSVMEYYQDGKMVADKRTLQALLHTTAYCGKVHGTGNQSTVQSSEIS